MEAARQAQDQAEARAAAQQEEEEEEEDDEGDDDEERLAAERAVRLQDLFFCHRKIIHAKQSLLFSQQEEELAALEELEVSRTKPNHRH